MEDYTRQMLGVIRESERLQNAHNADAVQPNDYDYQEEVKKFKTQITSRVEIKTFNVYPNTNNVIFGGTFTDFTGLNFQMSLDEKDGLYINSEALQVTDDVVERITKLSGYYKNWADEWANKVIANYSNQSLNNGQE